jgi:DNA repair ATPase RecN
MAFKPTKPTHKKRKVTKRKSQSKPDIKEPNTFVTSSPGFTKFTTKKEKLSRGKYSSQTIIQKLEALESLSLEELLQSVQTLEESLQDLPSIEDTIAEVERLTEQMEKELEEYTNEP